MRGTESWARGMGSSPGGVANMATALARLGLKTSLAAAFGDDHYGEAPLHALEQGQGIDLAPSRTVPDGTRRSPCRWRTRASDDGQPRARRPPPEEPAPEHAPRARAAVASLTPGTRAHWIAESARAGTRIFADVGWDDTGRWDLAGLADLEHCEAFLPNADEAMRYTGADCPGRRARADRVRATGRRHPRCRGRIAVDGRTGETAQRSPRSPWRPSTPPVPGTSRRRVRDGHPRRLAARRARARLAGLTAALSVQEFGGSLSAPSWAEIAAWWRRVQSVDDQEPAALRRYALLESLLPEVTPSVAAATGGPNHRLPAGRPDAPPAAARLPWERGFLPPGPRTRAEKPYGTVTPPSYPWNRKAAPWQASRSRRKSRPTSQAIDSDTHSSQPRFGAGTSAFHRPGHAPHGDRAGFRRRAASRDEKAFPAADIHVRGDRSVRSATPVKSLWSSACWTR